MRRALEFVTPFKSAIGAIVALALVLAVTNAIDPLVMKYLFDALGRSTGRGELGRALLAFIGIEITRATLTGVLAARTWRVRLRIDYAVRERRITKLHALPISYHQ
jgi:ATP-binding cassette subfamily B protein